MYVYLEVPPKSLCLRFLGVVLPWSVMTTKTALTVPSKIIWSVGPGTEGRTKCLSEKDVGSREITTRSGPELSLILSSHRRGPVDKREGFQGCRRQVPEGFLEDVHKNIVVGGRSAVALGLVEGSTHIRTRRADLFLERFLRTVFRFLQKGNVLLCV